MASIIEKAKVALGGGVSHAAPEIRHSKKILLAVTGATAEMPEQKTGFHWSELMDAWEVFTKGGWACDIVSESGSATPDEGSVGAMASAVEKEKWNDKQYPLHKDLANIQRASMVNASNYVGIYFAGGHACCVDLPTARDLKKLTAQIYENGGVVGAVCHGPAIFQDLKLSSGKSLIEGREVTGFSERGEKEMKVMDWMEKHNFLTMEGVAKREGGLWKEVDGGVWKDFTIVSDRIVTGVNPASAKSLASKMLDFLPKDADLKEGEKAGVSSTEKTSSGIVSSKDVTAAAASQTAAVGSAGTGSKLATDATEREKEGTTYTGERTASTTTTV